MTSDAHLTALDELLLSVTDEDGMLLSEFDGFCAGVIVCPEMIPPSEWLLHVWGSNGTPEFESEEGLQDALDLIMGHYNDVARTLVPPEFEYGPVLEHDSRTDETIWETWVSGFERSMRLRRDAWEQIVESESEEAGASVTMMLALHGIAEGDSDLPDRSISDLSDKAPDMITDIVIALNRWTKGYPQNVNPTKSGRSLFAVFQRSGRQINARHVYASGAGSSGPDQDDVRRWIGPERPALVFRIWIPALKTIAAFSLMGGSRTSA